MNDPSSIIDYSTNLSIPGFTNSHLVTVQTHPLQVLVDILEPLRIPLLVLAAGLLVYGIWWRRHRGREKFHP